MSLGVRLAKWLIFSVLLALLPLALNYLHVLTRGGDPTLERLLGKGELLLIAASISAAAVGSVIGSGKDRLIAKVFWLFRVSCGSETQILQARGWGSRPADGGPGRAAVDGFGQAGRPSPRRSDAHRPRAGPTGPPRAPGGLSGLGAGPPSERHRLPTQDPEEPKI
jgi:hypothetical protein